MAPDSCAGVASTVSPSTTSTGVSDTSLPCSASSSSTWTCSPSATLACLPPDAITAYIAMRSYRANHRQQRATEEPAHSSNAWSMMHAAAGAVRALIGEVDQQSLADALAGHLHQAEIGDVEDLGAGLVAGQRGPERVDDLAAVVLDLHVDEVDHDDAADVAQTQLLGDLFGGLEVVAEHRLFEVRGADVLAGVDVDHRQRLGVLDDQRAAAGQPHLAVERLVQLLVDVLALVQRQTLGDGVVVLDAVGEVGVEGGDVVANVFEQRADRR